VGSHLEKATLKTEKEMGGGWIWFKIVFSSEFWR